MTHSIIEIPGSFTARVHDGRIVGYTFTPHAANAGYFGDEIFVIDGDHFDKVDDFWAMVQDTMMISSDERVATISVEWEE